MGQLTEGLLSLSGWAALACLFVLPALEAPAFLGLVLPGELALVLGGVLASQDRVPLAAALAAGTAGALAGDSAGYWIGRRLGPRLLATRLGRRVGPARLHRVESLLLRGAGGVAEQDVGRPCPARLRRRCRLAPRRPAHGQGRSGPRPGRGGRRGRHLAGTPPQAVVGRWKSRSRSSWGGSHLGPASTVTGPAAASSSRAWPR
jgi:hypothetical protein